MRLQKCDQKSKNHWKNCIIFSAQCFALTKRFSLPSVDQICPCTFKNIPFTVMIDKIAKESSISWIIYPHRPRQVSHFCLCLSLRATLDYFISQHNAKRGDATHCRYTVLDWSFWLESCYNTASKCNWYIEHVAPLTLFSSFGVLLDPGGYIGSCM